MSQSFYTGETIYSAGGVLINLKNNEIYLVFKKEAQEWLLPKGRINEGETIEKCAQREVFEGTNKKNNTQMDDENFDGKWFPKEEAVRCLKWEEDKKLVEVCFELS